MTTNIVITDVTNSTDLDPGTGSFDLLMQSAELHINKQFDEGRLLGTDYATVFLGGLQSVLSESIKFELSKIQASKQADLISEQIESENKNNEDGGLIDLQKRKIQEEIDLVIAKTAGEYRNIEDAKQKTIRDNLLNSKEVIKREKETELIITQKSELEANGLVNRDKINAEKILVDLKAIEVPLDGESGRLLNTANKELIDLKAVEIPLDGVASRDLSDANKTNVEANTALTNLKAIEVPLDGVASRALSDANKTNVEANTALTNLKAIEIPLDGAATRALSEANKLNVDASKLNTEANTLLVAANKLNVEADTVLKGKEEDKIDQEILVMAQKVLSATQEVVKMQKEVLLVDEKITQMAAETAEISANDKAERDLKKVKELEIAAGTVRADAENVEKLLLIQSQVTGMKAHSKQSLLKLMFEGYGINTTTTGEIPSGAPTSSTGVKLDAVANDILDDLGSTVNV